MKLSIDQVWEIFYRSVTDYHIKDDIHAEFDNPYDPQSFEAILYLKNRIDTVQWHLEDLIRKEDIDPQEALRLKRWIDKSNQQRTDIVEVIDEHFVELFKDVQLIQGAIYNTETLGWAIDRLSILALKIFHMEIEVNRMSSGTIHREQCKRKLDILLCQKQDLTSAINQLLIEIAKGKKRINTYKQMKMYNDPNLNPVLYNKQ